MLVWSNMTPRNLTVFSAFSLTLILILQFNKGSFLLLKCNTVVFNGLSFIFHILHHFVIYQNVFGSYILTQCCFFCKTRALYYQQIATKLLFVHFSVVGYRLD